MGRVQTPSIPVVLLALAVLAGVAFLALRPTHASDQSDRVRAEIQQALAQTLEVGGKWTAVTHFESPTMETGDAHYSGVTSPGTSPDELVDIRAVLRMIEDIGPVERLGLETVGSVSATHYSATVDPDLQSSEPDSIQDWPPKLEIWIDAAGMIRRYETSESYNDGNLLAGTTLETSPQ